MFSPLSDSCFRSPACVLLVAPWRKDNSAAMDDDWEIGGAVGPGEAWDFLGIRVMNLGKQTLYSCVSSNLHSVI